MKILLTKTFTFVVWSVHYFLNTDLNGKQKNPLKIKLTIIWNCEDDFRYFYEKMTIFKKYIFRKYC